MTKESQATRAAILVVLKSKRGVHKSELSRLTGRGWGTIGHHVYVLVRAGRIETEVHGRLLWVFLTEVPRSERDWLIATRAPQRRHLLDLIGLRKRSTIEALSSDLAVSKKVIRTHLGHLRRAGAVARIPGMPHEYEIARKGDKDE